MNEALNGVLALLIWPGFICSALLGWLYLWIGRKLFARLQGRQGPPFYQPFFDFIKLINKKTVVPGGINRGLFFGLPVVSLACIAGALALLPAPGLASVSFEGDLILFLYLLEMPALIDVLAGYISRSPYAQVGAAREAVLTLGYNLPLITAWIALSMQAGSSSLRVIVAQPFGPTQLFAVLALLLALPAVLKITPFSIANAEQEIVAGPHLEFNGVPLGIFELVHGLELTAMAGLFACLIVGPVANPIVALGLYLLASLAVVALTTLLSAVTARLKVQHALGFYWRWGTLAAAAAVIAAAIWK
jgi:NADH-quinone oxidoreductase subunit H